ncbi:uncharacterized protein A4U43_C04F2620 [Asparagus officinalis]|uniref:Tetraspanin family protein n=1 Tax=Asparagus officinalis TaxID=4686 RepID=A0A5P1EYE9_ASPOF|nr:tetraspanin-18-like isoform X1 [Asparagus officinalis]ONK70894.1 uncharacterized protein A4U43_C04F2620 [Asparagus officinalis]
MRPSILQSSTSSFLKFLNYLQTFAGAFVLLYSLWMLNDWNRHGVDKSSAPWFVYTMMAFGVFMCLIALVGYIAAGVVNGFCLCSYAVFILILILIEAGLMADLLFNEHWEEDFPHDATEELKSLRAFIEANIDIFKWVAVTLVVVQTLSLLLAIILRSIVPLRRMDNESNEDFTGMRSPLLNLEGGLPSPSNSVDRTTIQPDSWSSRMRDKYGFVPSPLSNDTTTGKISDDQRK